jgi:diadenosine tetraphosphate (Ap4A) HIT family hydrolase
MIENCLICRKHNNLEAIPPGGYIYEDEHWMACHAPINVGPLGTLFIESKRHFLDFAELNEAEQASYGILASKIYKALKPLINAERIYQLSIVEGIPHFHVWFVPRAKDIVEHGIAFLSRDDSCEEKDAIELVSKLREAMK